MSNTSTPVQIAQIRNLLIEDINAWLKAHFPGSFPKGTELSYSIPSDWLFLAGEVKKRYSDAGWNVRLTIEITRPAGDREGCLVFGTIGAAA